MPVWAMLLSAGVQLTSMAAAWTQGLPPTIMGKFVQQPGDNQYGGAAQYLRHNAGNRASQAATGPQSGQQSAPSAWTPTPRPARPDVSIQPIAADEPISPAGFPPIPQRLDLPISMAPMNGAPMGGGVPGRGVPSGNQQTPYQGMHQHYAHYQPGAFSPQAQNNGAPRSGYKCLPADPVPSGAKTDYYGTNVGSANSPPQYSGVSPSALSRLGKEPTLSSQQDKAVMTPQAPTPVVVNQATTQDLSLPDDDFAQHKPPNQNSFAKRLGRQVGNTVVQTMYMGISRASGYAYGYHF